MGEGSLSQGGTSTVCVARATRKSVHVCLVLKPASSHVCETAKYSYRSEHPVFSLLEAGGEHPWKDEDGLQLQAKEEKNRRGYHTGQ